MYEHTKKPTLRVKTVLTCIIIFHNGVQIPRTEDAPAIHHKSFVFPKERIFCQQAFILAFFYEH